MRFASLLLLAAALPPFAAAAATPTAVPTRTPCPDWPTATCVPPACTTPANTITPAPSPSPIVPSPTAQTIPILQSTVGSFGSRWELDFRSLLGLNGVAGLDYGPAPYFGSADPQQPNTFSPLTSQGVFKGGMWHAVPPTAQQDYYAGRVIFMNGSVSSGVLAIESGNGKSRYYVNPAPPPNAYAGYPVASSSKYLTGELHIGTATRGGTIFDTYSVMGAANMGTTNLSNPLGDAEAPGGSFALERMFFSIVEGSENVGWIGRRIAPDMGKFSGPLDARRFNFREDSDQGGDTWDISPAVVMNLRGSVSTAFIDNKKTDVCLTPNWTIGTDSGTWGGAPSTPPYNAGYTQTALGHWALVSAPVPGSWVNVGGAVGVMAMLSITSGSPNLAGTPGYYCAGERSGSRIRDWKGVYSLALISDPCEVLLDSAVGFFASDPNPANAERSMSGVTANPRLVDDEASTTTLHSEAYAALVTRGTVVLGGGRRPMTGGYDADVVHVNDVVHLAPRSEPPRFADNVPPSDRVGLMYFDAVHNTLRVSVAAPRSSSSDWRDAEVAWVNLSLDLGAVDPVRDVVGNRAGSERANEELNSAIKEAGSRAAAGESHYVAPALEVIASPSVAGELPVTLLFSHFGAQAPRIYWRKVTVDRVGHRTEHSWQRLREEEFAAPQGLRSRDALTGTLPVGDEPAAQGPKTRFVEFLAVHPETGKTVTSSAPLP